MSSQSRARPESGSRSGTSSRSSSGLRREFTIKNDQHRPQESVKEPAFDTSQPMNQPILQAQPLLDPGMVYGVEYGAPQMPMMGGYPMAFASPYMDHPSMHAMNPMIPFYPPMAMNAFTQHPLFNPTTSMMGDGYARPPPVPPLHRPPPPPASHLPIVNGGRMEHRHDHDRRDSGDKRDDKRDDRQAAPRSVVVESGRYEERRREGHSDRSSDRPKDNDRRDDTPRKDHRDEARPGREFRSPTESPTRERRGAENDKKTRDQRMEKTISVKEDPKANSKASSESKISSKASSESKADSKASVSRQEVHKASSEPKGNYRPSSSSTSKQEAAKAPSKASSPNKQEIAKASSKTFASPSSKQEVPKAGSKASTLPAQSNKNDTRQVQPSKAKITPAQPVSVASRVGSAPPLRQSSSGPTDDELCAPSILPSRVLCVRNLAKAANLEHLRAALARFGSVAELKSSHLAGRGIVFARYHDLRSAIAAIKLNGKKMLGSNPVIHFTKLMSEGVCGPEHEQATLRFTHEKGHPISEATFARILTRLEGFGAVRLFFGEPSVRFVEFYDTRSASAVMRIANIFGEEGIRMDFAWDTLRTDPGDSQQSPPPPPAMPLSPEPSTAVDPPSIAPPVAPVAVVVEKPDTTAVMAPATETAPSNAGSHLLEEMSSLLQTLQESVRSSSVSTPIPGDPRLRASLGTAAQQSRVSDAQQSKPPNAQQSRVSLPNAPQSRVVGKTVGAVGDKRPPSRDDEPSLESVQKLARLLLQQTLPGPRP